MLPALKDFLRRVDQRMAKLGIKSDNALCLTADIARDYISKRRAAAAEGSRIVPKLATVEKVARALETSSDWLLYQRGPEEASPNDATDDSAGPDREHGINISGRVSASGWRAPGLEETVLGTAPADPRHDPGGQFALQVEGDSINRIAQPGDLLICLSIDHSGVTPRNGELVIAEQTDVAGKVMTTAKRLYVNSNHFELRPESENPIHKPLRYPKGDGSAILPDGSAIRQVAIVLGVYRPIR